MKKAFLRITSVFLCVVMLFSLFACTKTPEDTAVSSSVINNTDASGELKTAILNDENTKNFNLLYTYGNDEIESYLFWCDLEMTNLYIVKVMATEENWLTDGIHLYEQASVKPNEAINYKQMVPEGMPVEAVLYTAGGKNYAYAIAYNGRDGGIDLMEINGLTVDADEFNSRQPSYEEEPEVTTTTPAPSTEMMVEVYWVSEDFEVFAKEMTIESESKWHVWKALKLSNQYIPRDCSLLDFAPLKGREGVLELNFSESFNQIKGSMVEYLLLQAIANTFINAYDLIAVRFKVEGEYYQSDNCPAGIDFEFTNF